MARSRAEIQKSYRQRKKQNDPKYLHRERLRTASNRVPAAQLSRTKLKNRRNKNKIYCAMYRLKKLKKSQAYRQDDATETTSNSEEILPQPVQSEAVSSSGDLKTDSVPGTSRKTRLTSPQGGKLLVRIPFRQKSGPPKRRSKALKKARDEVGRLEQASVSYRRIAKRWQKRYERLKNKMRNETEVRNAHDINNTPRSRTVDHLRQNGVSPRDLPRGVVRKLVVSNCLLDEIKDARHANNSDTIKGVLNSVVSGKIVKRYKCGRFLNRATGLCRRGLTNVATKAIAITKRSRQTHIKSLIRNKVVSFLERDDVSRCMPGKQDAFKVDGVKRQTRILNDYLSNLHDRYTAENPTIKLSFSAFCKLRPRNIKLTCALSRNTCLCTKHQNMALKLKALTCVGIQISSHPEVVSRNVSLEQMKEKLSQVPDGEIEYNEWSRIEVEGKKVMRVVKKSLSKPDFTVMMSEEYSRFLEHVIRVRTQYKALCDLKARLPGGEMIVQMDFAENFTCQTMDEIQSAYWNATSATLHPVVAYYMKNDTIEHNNYVFISDVNSHNANAVFAIIEKLVPILKQDVTDLKKIHYWTDSPSSQYRNRYIFNVITNHQKLFGVSAQWNYFESGHGKGPCDGIGGTVKRMASEAVKQGKCIIQDAKDLFSWAEKNQKSIRYFFYSREDYDAAANYQSSQTVKPVSGTMKVHAVLSQAAGEITVRDTSCYCSGCLEETQLCDGWTRHVICNTQNHNEVLMTGSSQEKEATADEDLPVPGSPQDRTVLDADSPRQVPDVESFIAAMYDDKWYVGQVLEVDEIDGEAFVSFMVSPATKGQKQFKWPDEPDEILVPFEDILCLVNPIPVGRSRRSYSLSSEDNMKVQDSLAMFFSRTK